MGGRRHGQHRPQRQSSSPAPGGPLEGFGKGSRVWYRAEPDQWLPGALASQPHAECKITLDSNVQHPQAGKTISADVRSLEPANPSILDGATDLTNLSYLNEPSILHGLRLRYEKDEIYTQAGPVLIAINPFKKVPLYSKNTVGKYMRRGYKQQEADFGPHVFLTADSAYKAMCRDGKSQSIIISGESGAGKTETTKIAMQYLAGLAGGTGVETAVLQTNPLLEAFGNAKTLRNNNSSRFGKLIEIFFNHQRHICAALIQTYLLEKLRVVHQLPGERNYHIFYQLCCGLSEEEAAVHRIPKEGVRVFRYLNSSGCCAIPGVDDAADFQEVRQAMLAVNIDLQSQARVWSLLSAILWLGNIDFVEGPGDGVRVAPGPALQQAAALLQVPEAGLASVLCSRLITAGGETIRTMLGAEAAADTRDALAKALYAALFGWLVARINQALADGRPSSDTSLSILDIYGFECFDDNSFEQLCINYANERLQQQFNRHQFRMEQEVYEEEGIDWTHIPFVDNQQVLDLIEGPHPKHVSVLSLLDEQCVFPKASDATYAQKVREELDGNPCLSWKAHGPSIDFEIKHYAGKVVYSCVKFLDKNRDTISPDLVALLRGSKERLLQQLAEEVGGSQERRTNQTVASRFRDQLRRLIERLEGTKLHFVRCIKPNNVQRSNLFDTRLVMHQLRCCGVLEVARIARQGYPTRYLFAQFASAYGILLPAKAREAGQSELDLSRALLERFGIPETMYRVGCSRLFFRAGVLGRLEDCWARIHRSVLMCQTLYRMARCRRAFLRCRGAAVTLQAHWKGRLARRRYKLLLQQYNASRRIQAAFRAWAARRRFLALRSAALACQSSFRRTQMRRKRLEERQRLRALTQQQEGASPARTGERQRGPKPGVVRSSSLPGDPERYSGRSPPREYDVDWCDVDPEELRAAAVEQLTMWEEYAGKLEEQISQLVDHNRQLQHALASVREDLVSSSAGTPASGCCSSEADWSIPPGQPGQQAANILQPRSCNGENRQPLPATALSPHGMAQGPGERDAKLSRERTQAYMCSLAAEFERKSHLFEDDAAFISEVRRGQSQAPGMNPDAELRLLKVRFNNFQKDFKMRLSATGEVLRLIEKEEKRQQLEQGASRMGWSRHKIVPTRPSSQASEASDGTPRSGAEESGMAQRAFNTLSVLGMGKLSLRRSMRGNVTSPTAQGR